MDAFAGTAADDGDGLTVRLAVEQRFDDESEKKK